MDDELSITELPSADRPASRAAPRRKANRVRGPRAKRTSRRRKRSASWLSLSGLTGLDWARPDSRVRILIVPVLIFSITLLGYYLSNPTPLDWYKHQVYLAVAITQGTLDLGSVGVPDFYHDLVPVDGHRYLPYPPAPAAILLPFVAIWGSSFSEAYFSMFLGAINVVLFWHLLGLLNVSRTTRFLLVPFFGFGTAHFYAATTGTLWFYNHVVAVFFLLLAIIFMLRRTSPIIPALFLGAAFLSRHPTILAAPFFFYWMIRQRHPTVLSREALLDRESLREVGLFCAALVPFILFIFWYDAVRFDSIFDTGYVATAESYADTGIPYAFYLADNPDAPSYGAFDIRNVPLHLYTIFFMPPEFHADWSVLRPSPYGMSVLLTSPAFIFAAFVKRNDPLKVASWLAIGLVSIAVLTSFSQGWVQYGYRYLLDFTPFLLLLTALGFEDNQSPQSTRIKVAMIAVAIVAGFWGRYWGTKLTW